MINRLQLASNAVASISIALNKAMTDFIDYSIFHKLSKAVGYEVLF